MHIARCGCLIHHNPQMRWRTCRTPCQRHAVMARLSAWWRVIL